MLLYVCHVMGSFIMSDLLHGHFYPFVGTHEWCCLTLREFIFLQNCTHLQRFPICCFSNGSCARVFFFFMVLVSLGNSVLCLGRSGLKEKNHISLWIHGERMRMRMGGVYPPRLFLTALHLSAYILRGATQIECCNISYQGNNVFLVFREVSGRLEHLTLLSSRGLNSNG